MTTNLKLDPHKGMSRLVRPHFSPGLLLQDDDLTQAVNYTRELSRLMFRSLFGCGVICGLTVKETKYDCGKINIVLNEGVALDCKGDPIHVPSEQTIRVDPKCIKENTGELWIVIRGFDKCCAPRTPVCPSDDDEAPAVCTREQDGFEIHVVDKRECVCGCPDAAPAEWNKDCQCANPKSECYADHYAGNCAGCSDCQCEWILLARLDRDAKDLNKWTATHHVRRFVRPVLISDRAVKPKKATVEADPLTVNAVGVPLVLEGDPLPPVELPAPSAAVEAATAAAAAAQAAAALVAANVEADKADVVVRTALERRETAIASARKTAEAAKDAAARAAAAMENAAKKPAAATQPAPPEAAESVDASAAAAQEAKVLVAANAEADKAEVAARTANKHRERAVTNAKKTAKAAKDAAARAAAAIEEMAGNKRAAATQPALPGQTTR